MATDQMTTRTLSGQPTSALGILSRARTNIDQAMYTRNSINRNGVKNAVITGAYCYSNDNGASTLSGQTKQHGDHSKVRERVKRFDEDANERRRSRDYSVNNVIPKKLENCINIDKSEQNTINNLQTTIKKETSDSLITNPISCENGDNHTNDAKLKERRQKSITAAMGKPAYTSSGLLGITERASMKSVENANTAQEWKAALKKRRSKLEKREERNVINTSVSSSNSGTCGEQFNDENYVWRDGYNSLNNSLNCRPSDPRDEKSCISTNNTRNFEEENVKFNNRNPVLDGNRTYKNDTKTNSLNVDCDTNGDSIVRDKPMPVSTPKINGSTHKATVINTSLLGDTSTQTPCTKNHIQTAYNGLTKHHSLLEYCNNSSSIQQGTVTTWLSDTDERACKPEVNENFKPPVEMILTSVITTVEVAEVCPRKIHNSTVSVDSTSSINTNTDCYNENRRRGSRRPRNDNDYIQSSKNVDKYAYAASDKVTDVHASRRQSFVQNTEFPSNCSNSVADVVNSSRRQSLRKMAERRLIESSYTSSRSSLKRLPRDSSVTRPTVSSSAKISSASHNGNTLSSSCKDVSSAYGSNSIVKKMQRTFEKAKKCFSSSNLGPQSLSLTNDSPKCGHRKDSADLNDTVTNKISKNVENKTNRPSNVLYRTVSSDSKNVVGKFSNNSCLGRTQRPSSLKLDRNINDAKSGDNFLRKKSIQSDGVISAKSLSLAPQSSDGEDVSILRFRASNKFSVSSSSAIKKSSGDIDSLKGFTSKVSPERNEKNLELAVVEPFSQTRFEKAKKMFEAIDKSGGKTKREHYMSQTVSSRLRSSSKVLSLGEQSISVVDIKTQDGDLARISTHGESEKLSLVHPGKRFNVKDVSSSENNNIELEGKIIYANTECLSDNSKTSISQDIPKENKINDEIVGSNKNNIINENASYAYNTDRQTNEHTSVKSSCGQRYKYVNSHVTNVSPDAVSWEIVSDDEMAEFTPTSKMSESTASCVAPRIEGSNTNISQNNIPDVIIKDTKDNENHGRSRDDQSSKLQACLNETDTLVNNDSEKGQESDHLIKSGENDGVGNEVRITDSIKNYGGSTDRESEPTPALNACNISKTVNDIANKIMVSEVENREDADSVIPDTRHDVTRKHEKNESGGENISGLYNDDSEGDVIEENRNGPTEILKNSITEILQMDFLLDTGEKLDENVAIFDEIQINNVKTDTHRLKSNKLTSTDTKTASIQQLHEDTDNKNMNVSTKQHEASIDNLKYNIHSSKNIFKNENIIYSKENYTHPNFLLKRRQALYKRVRNCLSTTNIQFHTDIQTCDGTSDVIRSHSTASPKNRVDPLASKPLSECKEIINLEREFRGSLKSLHNYKVMECIKNDSFEKAIGVVKDKRVEDQFDKLISSLEDNKTMETPTLRSSTSRFTDRVNLLKKSVSLTPKPKRRQKLTTDSKQSVFSKSLLQTFNADFFSENGRRSSLNSRDEELVTFEVNHVCSSGGNGSGEVDKEVERINLRGVIDLSDEKISGRRIVMKDKVKSETSDDAHNNNAQNSECRNNQCNVLKYDRPYERFFRRRGLDEPGCNLMNHDENVYENALIIARHTPIIYNQEQCEQKRRQHSSRETRNQRNGLYDHVTFNGELKTSDDHPIDRQLCKTSNKTERENVQNNDVNCGLDKSRLNKNVRISNELKPTVPKKPSFPLLSKTRWRKGLDEEQFYKLKNTQTSNDQQKNKEDCVILFDNANSCEESSGFVSDVTSSESSPITEINLNTAEAQTSKVCKTNKSDHTKISKWQSLSELCYKGMDGIDDIDVEIDSSISSDNDCENDSSNEDIKKQRSFSNRLDFGGNNQKSDDGTAVKVSGRLYPIKINRSDSSFVDRKNGWSNSCSGEFTLEGEKLFGDAQISRLLRSEETSDLSEAANEFSDRYFSPDTEPRELDPSDETSAYDSDDEILFAFDNQGRSCRIPLDYLKDDIRLGLCWECGKSFKSQTDLWRHKRDVH